MRCECPENRSHPSAQSAAPRRTGALTRTTTPDHRGLVEAVFDGVESASVSSELGMFVRDYRVKNSFECSLSHLCNTW